MMLCRIVTVGLQSKKAKGRLTGIGGRERWFFPRAVPIGASAARWVSEFVSSKASLIDRWCF